MAQARDSNGRFTSGGNGAGTIEKVDGEKSFVEVSKQVSMTQVGQTGLNRSYGVVHEEFLPELQGRAAVRIFREMRENDPVVGGMFFAIEQFMRNVDWFIDPADDDDKSKADAEFLEQCRDDMSNTWSDFVSEVMSMMQYGWSYFEEVYKKRQGDEPGDDEDGNPLSPSQYTDGKIGWRKIEIRSQDSLDRWRFSNIDGGIEGMWQMPPPDYTQIFLPIQKCLLFRTTSRKNNPEGRSVLRNAYRPWYFKKRMEEIEGVGVERDLAGLPVAEVPASYMSENASTEEKAALQSIVELVRDIRRDQKEGVVWPQQYDKAGNKMFTLTLLNSGGTRQFPTDTIITRYEQRMALTILADFILLGTEAQGSFAMSTNKTALFQAALGAWLDMIQDVMNRYAVPRLFRLNGVKGPYPKFRHDDVQKHSIADLGTFIAAVAGAGGQLFPDTELENYLRQQAQLPIREEEDEYKEQEQQLRETELEQKKEMARAQIDAAKRGELNLAGSKEPRKKEGSPTKTTGPVKSKLPPQSRRRTKALNASENVKKLRKHATHRQKSHGNWARVPKNRVIANKIRTYMNVRYPNSVLGWLDDVDWEGPKTVPLSQIDMARRPGGRDPKKVRGIAEKVKSGAKMDPVVLVDTGDGELKIADGYHRTLAFQHAGKKTISAYVGETDIDFDKWHKKVHDAKINKRKRLQPAGYLRESERIRANAKLEINQKPHTFLAAKWTHPNGHPRCLRCGGEERDDNGDMRCRPDIEKFDPNQPRDYRGRWVDIPGRGSSAARAIVSSLTAGDPIDTEVVLDMTGGSAEKHLMRGPDGKYRFTKERVALHDKIIADTLKGHKPQKNPRYNLMGGGPASGKSTMEKKRPEIMAESAIVNADDVKAKLPEYEEKTDGTAAAFTHEESSYIAKRILAEAFDKNINLTLDGTGDSSVKSLKKKIKQAKDVGYEVHAYYVTIDTDEAVARAQKRAERTGRVVPETIIRNTHKNVSIVLPEVLEDFTSVELFDNNESEIRTVLKGQKGNVEIVNEELWQKFLNKAG